MRKLTSLLMILITGFTFSQKKLTIDNVVVDINAYTPYIFDDGSSIIIAKQSLNAPKFSQNSYSPEGEVLVQKQLKESFYPQMYGSKDKFWLEYEVGGSKMIISQTDFSGNTVKTEIKDKGFKYQRCFTLLNEKGNMEIFLKQIRSNYKMEKNMIPYIKIEYNPNDKSYKVSKFIDIPNIVGEVRFIGTRGGESYFINWTKGKSKGSYTFKTLAVNDKNEARTCSTFEYNSGVGKALFVGAEYISHFGNMDEFNNLYFTFNYFSKAEKKGDIKLNYDIFKINAANEFSQEHFSVDTYYGTGAVNHPPMYCFPEEEEATTFYIGSGGTGVLFSTEFDGAKLQAEGFNTPSTPRIYFYKDEFPTLYEAALKYPKGKGTFKICDDGFARLIIITEKAECLLFSEEIH